MPGGVGNIQDIYPLAPLQEGILFHHLLGQQGDTYLLPSLMAFDTRDRLDRFLAAMQAVIGRHDLLRTGVLWEGLPQPVQVVLREAVLPVQEVQLTGADAAQELRERFDPRRYRLDVRQAPMQRAFVGFDAQHGRWLLLLLSHHLVTDHTTLEVVFAEVRAHLVGEALRLSEPVPFRTYVAQARSGLTEGEHEQFFRTMLEGIEEPTAPFGMLDVHGDGSAIEEVRQMLPASLSRQLRACARAAGVSVASVCHLAWGQVLSRLTGREDVVFGTVLFGRMQSGAAQAVGLFINTLPVRVRVGEDSVGQGLRHTHERLGQLLQHEHASLALAQRCSGVVSPAPLFTTLLNYRHNRAVGGAAQASAPERMRGSRGCIPRSAPTTR